MGSGREGSSQAERLVSLRPSATLTARPKARRTTSPSTSSTFPIPTRTIRSGPPSSRGKRKKVSSLFPEVPSFQGPAHSSPRQGIYRGQGPFESVTSPGDGKDQQGRRRR